MPINLKTLAVVAAASAVSGAALYRVSTHQKLVNRLCDSLSLNDDLMVTIETLREEGSPEDREARLGELHFEYLAVMYNRLH